MRREPLAKFAGGIVATENFSQSIEFGERGGFGGDSGGCLGRGEAQFKRSAEHALMMKHVPCRGVSGAGGDEEGEGQPSQAQGAQAGKNHGEKGSGGCRVERGKTLPKRKSWPESAEEISATLLPVPIEGRSGGSGGF